MDTADLLGLPESKTLEFKRDLSSPEGILRTIVAFANTSGGTIVIGVEDSHYIRGVANILDAEERLANIISDSIAPKIIPELEILKWRKSQLLVVQIHPSPLRPHYLKREGSEAGVYVRIGSTNRRADPELIQELGRSSRGVVFDEQPISELRLEAIDFEAASEVFAQFKKLKQNDLSTLHLVTEHQGRKVPTVGGLLLFGNKREEFFPDAWIQAGRFKGVNKAHIIEHIQIRNHLPNAVEDAIAFISKHLDKSVHIGKIRRYESSIPPIVVREVVINAIVHTDYSQKGAPIRISIFDDRLEVENPGLLPFGMTVDDLHRGVSKLRNRVIGRTFQALKLIEQWGSGVQRMFEACEEAGLLPPSFEEIATRFRVTIKTTRAKAPQLENIDAIDEKILRFIGSKKGQSTQEVAVEISRTPRATRDRLAGLVARGFIREISMGPKDPKKRFIRLLSQSSEIK